MLFNGICEIISIGSVVPFLSVLVNSENLWQNPFIKRISPYIGIEDHTGLLLPVTVIFIFSIFLSAYIKLLNIWATERLSASIGSDFSSSAFERTLYQPYSVHISRNSSDLIAFSKCADKNIFGDIKGCFKYDFCFSSFIVHNICFNNC